MSKKTNKKQAGAAVHCAHDRLALVTELRPHPKNPNQHPPEQVTLLAKIIAHQGWRAPVVVSKRSGFIVAGHGRLLAALELGLERVPVNDQEFASDADELAHLAADNRIAELAETDGAKLKDLLLELDTGAFDMDLSGFDGGELERVINYFKAESVTAPTLADGDRQPFRQCTFTVHDSQFAEIETAMRTAKAAGGGASDVNENSNGNALAWICQEFNRRTDRG